MNADLSLTFNLTAAMFLAVWSPFFILSMVDLISDMVARKDLRQVNFALRCTLLIIGSAKPAIYLICLKRFRDAWKCIGLFGGSGSGSSTMSTEKTENNRTKSTKALQPISGSSFVLGNQVQQPLDLVLSSTQC